MHMDIYIYSHTIHSFFLLLFIMASFMSRFENDQLDQISFFSVFVEIICIFPNSLF